MKKIFCLFFISLLISGCTFFKTPDIKGVVLDAETGKPIADARIYAKWQRTVSGPGGKTSGGISKEIRLTTKEDGSFLIPAYTLINLVPYPFGQGGTFHVVVYGHGHKYKNFTFHETENFENPKYAEFKKINHVVVKMVEIKTAKEYWENMKELDIKDSSFDLDDYRYFIEKYPYSTDAPRAQYYIGYTYEDEIKDYEKAIEEYAKVLKNYPGTDAAKSAEEHIKTLKGRQ